MMAICDQAPGGRLWTTDATFSPPVDAHGDDVYVGSDGVGWSPMGEHHQHTGRKRAYYRGWIRSPVNPPARSCGP